MKKYPVTPKFAATAHKLAVNCLIGLTGIGLGIVSIQVYAFLTAVRPEVNKQKIAREAEEQNQ